jgi:hypothetical protein
LDVRYGHFIDAYIGAFIGAFGSLTLSAIAVRDNRQVIVEPLSPKGERFLLHRPSLEVSPQAFNVRSSRPRQSHGYRDKKEHGVEQNLKQGAIHLGPEGPSFLASTDKFSSRESMVFHHLEASVVAHEVAGGMVFTLLNLLY